MNNNLKLNYATKFLKTIPPVKSTNLLKKHKIILQVLCKYSYNLLNYQKTLANIKFIQKINFTLKFKSKTNKKQIFFYIFANFTVFCKVYFEISQIYFVVC